MRCVMDRILARITTCAPTRTGAGFDLVTQASVQGSFSEGPYITPGTRNIGVIIGGY